MDTLSGRRLKILLFLLFGAGVLAFLFSIGDLVKILLVSALLAYILDPLVTQIETYGVTRTLATILLFLGFFLTIGIVVVILLPFIINEIKNIREGFDPAKTQQVIADINFYLNAKLSAFGVKDLDITGQIAEKLLDYVNLLFANLANLFSLFTSIIIIPFAVFFLLKDGREIRKELIILVPNRYFEFTLNLLYKMDKQLGNYFRGQILDALIIGFVAAIAMLLLDVKYALLIGTFAGLTNLVPYIGPLVGAVTAIALTLLDTGDFTLVWQIGLAFAAVQLFDNIIVQPTVIAKNVDMSPLVVLLVVIIGGKFFGILGMLLSVPFISMIKVLLQEGGHIYRKYRFAQET